MTSTGFSTNIQCIMYIKRLLGDHARKTLARGKSILLLGPRQTGKTTFVRHELKPDIEISFVSQTMRIRYEKNPALLEKEIQSAITKFKRPPIIFIDEVQKIPSIMDSVQYLIDNKLAQFILSGSSARKLKHGKEVNLLPGRVVVFYLSPLTYQEIPNDSLTIEDILIFGSLPGIVLEPGIDDKEVDLSSYVTTYLEDEIRTESIVRNIGHFAQFLQVAAGESGNNCNMTKLSQDIGVAATTISSYFQILIDCLIAHRIDPITESSTKRRLISSVKYLFFDLGVRRACANEGTKLPMRMLANLFEQFVGLQILAYKDIYHRLAKLRYWRDSAGPEVDFVLDIERKYIPIEVKFNSAPTVQDARHLVKFLNEYENSTKAYIVCCTPQEYMLSIDMNIKVIPWQQIHTIFAE